LRALEGLNPAQREAVQTTQGPLLIVAGPGSGKTRVIVHRIAYLIEEEGVSPSQIAAVTFTNKAAREMRERVEHLLGPRGRGLTVGTFHRTCAEILRRDGMAVGVDPRFVIYDDGDQVALIRGLLREDGIDEKRVAPRAILSQISRAKAELVDPLAYARRAEGRWPEMVAGYYRRYEDLLERNRALDFDDLLVRVVDLFREASDVLDRYQERYRYLMVDEFQDTNVAQYAIVRLLGSRYRNVCAVGDVDQAIYSWRAADPRNVFQFERDFPELKVVLLEQNYRSTPSILELADAVIRHAPGRRDKRLWTENPAGDAPVLFRAYDEAHEAQWVIQEIERLRRAGAASYGDCAVLYRTNTQSRPFEDALVRHDVPYRLVGGTRFYERKEIKDVLAYLRLVLNPDDDLSLERVIKETRRGLGDKSLQDLKRWAARQEISIFKAMRLAGAGEAGADGSPNPLGARARRACAEFVALVDDLGQDREERTLSLLLDDLLDRSGYAAHLRDGTDEGEERWANVQELRTKAAGYEDVDAAVALEDFLADISLVQDVDSLEVGNDAVTLITLHAAKGLEFPHVFLVGLEEGLFPHARSLEDPGQMEEERRLFFVGVTRAMRGLYLTHASSRLLYGRSQTNAPSQFLMTVLPFLHMPGPPGNRVGDPPPAVPRPREPAWPPATERAGPWPTEPPVRVLSRPAATPEAAITRPSPDPTSGPTYRPGDRVRHAKFGDGIVVASELRRGDEEVTVAFEGQGVRKLSLAYATLERR
jgi:DNA helicase II / ATP-dependent DNA helicase PcrA